MSIFRFLQRNTQPSLFQQYQNYLNQAMPDISGIFSLPPKTIGPVPVDPIEEKPEAGLTPEQLRLLYPQNEGGGGDGFQGGGAFGNLDLSKSKMFTKDVYKEVGPGYYSFEPEEIEAFYNPTLGMYQTYEGKNINPMFSNTGLTFGIGGGILKLLGMQPNAVQGFIPGSIRGFYDTPMDFFQRNKNIQKQTAKQKADIKKLQDKIDSGQYGGGDKGNIVDEVALTGKGTTQNIGKTTTPYGGGPGGVQSNFGGSSGGGTFGSSVNDADSFSDYS